MGFLPLNKKLRKEKLEEIRNENKVLGDLHPQLVFEERKVEEAVSETKEPEKPEQEKTEPEKSEPEKPEPEKPEPEKSEPEKSESKPEPVKPERLQQMIMDYKKASLEHVPFKTFFSAYNQTEKKALLAALQTELKKRSEARKKAAEKAAEKTTEEPAIQQSVLVDVKPVVHETFPKGYEDLPSWDKKTVQSVVDSRNLEKDKEHLSNLASAITEAMEKSMQANKPVEPVAPTVEAPSEEVVAPQPVEPEVVPIEPESMEPVAPTVEAPSEEVSAPQPVATSETATKEEDIVSKYGNLPSWEQEYLRKIAAYNAGKQDQEALNRQAAAEMVDAMANNPSEVATDDKTVEGPHL